MRELTRFVQDLPAPEVVRRELSRNLREQRLLKQLLKVSEQQKRVAEVAESSDAMQKQEDRADD